MSPMLPLKLKAALLVAALTVGALAASGYMRHRQLDRDFRAVVAGHLDSLAEAMAEDVSIRLETHLTLVERSAAAIDPAALTDATRAQKVLDEGTVTQTLFDGSALFGPDGGALASVPPLAPGARLFIGDRPYFRRATESGRALISEPVRTRTGRGPAVLVIAPVRGSAAAPAGYLAASLQLQRPNALGTLTDTRVGQTGHLEIVTGGTQPLFVVHPDPARLLAPAPAVARGDLDIDYLVVSRQLRGVDWQLRLVLPAWEALAPLAAARRSLLLELLGVGAVAAALAWLLMYRLLQPVTRLNRTMQALHADPQAALHVDTALGDERGQLARSFVDLVHELRRREAESLAVSARSPLGMFRAATDGRLSYVNDAYLQIHGITPDAYEKGWLDLVPADERDAAWAQWCAAVARPEPTFVTRTLQRRDGSSADVVVRSAPVIVDGKLLGHVGTVFDATERNREQKALRVLTTIFETTPDYVVQTTREGFVTYANPAIRRLEGLAPDAPVGHLNFADFNPPVTNERYASEILPAVKAHGVWVGETVILAGDGRELPVNHMVIAHRNAQGRIDHFSAVMRDISGAVAARHAADQAAALLSSLAELTPANLSVVDAELRYRFVNSRFERWIGLPRSQIIGRPAVEVLRPIDYERSLPHAQRALQGEEVRFERSEVLDGVTRHLAVSYLPLRLPDGHIDGFVGIAQDVTELREEAARLRQLSERDALTGVLNRTGFEASLCSLIDAGAGPRLALLYLDLDHFKPVNDRLGHAAGDEVLRRFARRLVATVRPTDIVARLGGDEFAVVLGDLPGADIARSIAAKIVAAAREPMALSEGEARIGTSVGVVYGLLPGESWQAFVARADEALLAAKRSGRGQVQEAA